MKKQDKKKTLIVVKSNDLIEASYKISLDEMRLLLLIIGSFTPVSEVPQREFEFTVAEFVERFGVDEKSAYKQVQQALDKLGGRWVLVESTDKYDVKVVFFTKQTYFKDEGRFIVILHDDLIPFIHDLKGKYTKYSIEYVEKFNSFAAIRIYEIIAQYKDMGRREVALSDLKVWLQLGNKYDRWDNFKRWVLDPALSEINEKSDLRVSYEPTKTGRKITGLVFKIGKKTAKPAKKRTKKAVELPERLVQPDGAILIADGDMYRTEVEPIRRLPIGIVEEEYKKGSLKKA